MPTDKDDKRERPPLGTGLAERAAKALEGRKRKIDSEVDRQVSGDGKGKVRDTSRDKAPQGFKLVK